MKGVLRVTRLLQHATKKTQSVTLGELFSSHRSISPTANAIFVVVVVVVKPGLVQKNMFETYSLSRFMSTESRHEPLFRAFEAH